MIVPAQAIIMQTYLKFTIPVQFRFIEIQKCQISLYACEHNFYMSGQLGKEIRA